MEVRDEIVAFLVESTIPHVTDKKRLPKGKEPSRLWDAVCRAHRDVTVARQYVSQYSLHSPRNRKNDPIAPNAVALELLSLLKDASRPEDLASRALIGQLSAAYPDVEPGAIQKLVNMTLKYLVVLQSCDAVNELPEGFPSVSEALCDCPLDSTILATLDDFKNEKWTQLDVETYQRVQEAIDYDPDTKTRLAYDFAHWGNR